MRCSALPLASKCRGSCTLSHGHGSIQSRLGNAFHELARAKCLGVALPWEEVKIKYALTVDEAKDIGFMVGNIVLNIPSIDHILADDIKLSGLAPEEGAEDLLTGTPDLAVIHNHVVTIVDWKGGFLDVEPPETNNQLIGYALLMQEFCERQAMTIDRFDLLIVQPRLNQIKAFSFTAAQLRALRPVIIQVILEAESDEAQFTVGPWCNSCYRCMHCPAFAGEVKALATFVEPGEIVEIKTVLQRMIPIAKAAARACDKIETLAKAFVAANGPIDLGDGQQYIQEVTTKKTVNAQKAMPILREYLDETALFGTISISATKIKEACADTKRGLSTVVINRLTDEGAITEEPTVRYTIKKGASNESSPRG